MSLAIQITREMGDIVGSDPKLLAECESICTIYNITAEDLKYKWEALNFNPNEFKSDLATQKPFTMDSIASIKDQLQKELAKKTKKKVVGSGATAGKLANINLSNRGKMPAFANRNAYGRVTEVKDEPMDGLIPRSAAGPSKVRFQGPKSDESAKKNRAYHYMYETPLKRMLDEQIDEFGEIAGEKYSIPDWGDPYASTDEEILVIGRITQDTEVSATGTAKLSTASIMIEGSRYAANGKRVALKFPDYSKLAVRGGPHGQHSFGLFPGAMVALKGKNGGGGVFAVTEILALPPPVPRQPTSSLQSFTMAVSCGAYTSDADLDFAPFKVFIESLKTRNPDVVVLLGPFIPSHHPLVAAGEITASPLALFQRRIIQPLQTYLDHNPGSIAVMLPSVRDIISQHNVFPQPELLDEVRMGDSRIHLLPNPSEFVINNVRFGATSVDSVFHLKKEEMVIRCSGQVESIPPTTITSSDLTTDDGTDAMANVCRHLLQQRSFYPLFPVPLDVSAELNLDVTHSEGMRFGYDTPEVDGESDQDDIAPDVLILPSRLKNFAKMVHSTLAINPSYVTKSTYAFLAFDAAKAKAAVGDGFQIEFVKI